MNHFTIIPLERNLSAFTMEPRYYRKALKAILTGEPSREERHGMCSYDPATTLPDFAATLVQEEDGTPIVSVFGEVDLHTVHDLDILMLKATSEAGESGFVIVDLGGVEFMDLTGLRVLINAQSILENSGGSLAVVCGGQAGRLFEVTGLADDFEIYDDLGSAVAAYPVGGYALGA